MPELISRRDLDFLLHEFLKVEQLADYPRYRGQDRASFDSVIDAAATLAEEQFLPHAAKSDAQEPHFDGERVHIIPEVKAALDAYIEAGFLGTAFNTEHGGLQLPYTVFQALSALFTAANIGTSGYVFLTGAAANLLAAHGTPAQQQTYMKPMIEGRWFGTMCLSEPQAGSSLGDIKTRAMPLPDGRYAISGNKMWISGGEHDLAENIVHHVLARIDGAAPGVKGISLFIVPKVRVNADGSLGAKNDVRLIGLNHKMGYRGTVNTALSFGDQGDCIGELVGAPGQGLACMFHMMNEARIGVGMGAAALGYAGYRYSLDYAKTRLQGRPASNKNPEAKPVAIIEHSDVRRMLLQQKAYVEGGLALCFYCAKLVDEELANPDEKARAETHLLLDILTPMAKSWPSEFCLEANKLAIQVLGGYGYTRDYPVERLYRDNRLNPIHEGTAGIQGLDLLGRKVMMQNGAAFKLLLAKMQASIASARSVGDPELDEYAGCLAKAIDAATRTTMTLGATTAQGKTDLFLANAHLYLEMLGHIVIAWIWLQQAELATRALPSASAVDRDFYDGKRWACRYFIRHELPKALRQAELLATLDDPSLSLPVAAL